MTVAVASETANSIFHLSLGPEITCLHSLYSLLLNIYLSALNAFIDYDCSIRSNTLNDLYRDWCFGLVTEEKCQTSGFIENASKPVPIFKVKIGCKYEENYVIKYSNQYTNWHLIRNITVLWWNRVLAWFLNGNQRHLGLMSIFFLNQHTVGMSQKDSVQEILWHSQRPIFIVKSHFKIVVSYQSFEKLIRSMKNLFENVEKSIGSNEFPLTKDRSTKSLNDQVKSMISNHFIHETLPFCEFWIKNHKVKIKIRRFSRYQRLPTL